MKCCVLIILCIVLIVSCDITSKNSIKIDGQTSIFISENEPEPIKKAVADLASDMEKVFGQPIAICHDLNQSKENSIVIAFNENLHKNINKLNGLEKFAIQAVKNRIVITGSDIRGCIYGIYHFAEKHLGVDPLYWWTDNEPTPKQKIEIPVDFRETSDSPTIKYRGLFINDEDLLTGWKPGTWFIDGISPEVWDKLFEAILRMKGNMVTPGTFIFPYEPQIKQAAERGLIITQHHIEVLGLNTYRWPDDVPYSFKTNKEDLISAWTNSVEQYPKDIEILWTVGYRGLHDRAFWEDDKDSPKSKQGRADLIKDAILAQMKIVKERFENPYFIMNTWGEGIEFVREGYLELPEEVTLVWADKGWGIIRDGGTIAEGNGIYYHTAMFNGRCNQLTEMIPISRIQSEIGRAVKANATEYLLVNCSDFRPVTMSTKAALSVAYNAKNWINDEDFHKKYLKDWCAKNFGGEVAGEVAGIYNHYYETAAQYTQNEEDVMGDNYYHRLTRSYLNGMVS
ncbi:MAG: glycosyl hydrolase 115 family protein, partial [Draconibacterium sp.]|nr:glycosyl hydrolase 115 family protein [Draconibacterium sp.]